MGACLVWLSDGTQGRPGYFEERLSLPGIAADF